MLRVSQTVILVTHQKLLCLCYSGILRKMYSHHCALSEAGMGFSAICPTVVKAPEPNEADKGFSAICPTVVKEPSVSLICAYFSRTSQHHLENESSHLFETTSFMPRSQHYGLAWLGLLVKTLKTISLTISYCLYVLNQWCSTRAVGQSYMNGINNI